MKYFNKANTSERIILTHSNGGSTVTHGYTEYEGDTLHAYYPPGVNEHIQSLQETHGHIVNVEIPQKGINLSLR